MAVLVYLVLLLAMAGYSNAVYCVCKDGLSDSVLQKSLDYACGAGADCTAILQNGACYNPVTVKDHCSYAVNSYFQKKGQISGSCDFAGTATTSSTPPAQTSSTCVYQASPSTTGGTGTTTPSTTTPSTTTPSTTTPSTSTPSTTTPSTSTPGTTTGTGTTPSSVFGTGTGSTLGPTGGLTNTDSRAAGVLLGSTNLLSSFVLTLWLSGLALLWG